MKKDYFKIFDGLEESDKVPKDIKTSIPKMKSALDVFMSSTEKSSADENIAGAIQSIPTIYKSMSEMDGPEPEAGDIISELEGILETWESKEYASDKDRWQEYTRDIQNLVNRYVDQKEDFYLNSPDTSLQEMATKLGYITK